MNLKVRKEGGRERDWIITFELGCETVGCGMLEPRSNGMCAM
jgi:hypothetical protein